MTIGKCGLAFFLFGRNISVLLVSQAGPGEVTKTVKVAIDMGYKHIDCASLYHNESEVGAAVYSKIVDGIVNRKDIFVVSKVGLSCCEDSSISAISGFCHREANIAYNME